MTEPKSALDRRTVLAAGVWAVPTITLAVAAPAAAASAITLTASPSSVSAMEGSSVFPTVLLSSSAGIAEDVLLTLTGTAFALGEVNVVRSLGDNGWLFVSDIVAPPSVSTATLTASLLSDPGVRAVVPLAVTPRPTGQYRFTSLVARGQRQTVELTATIEVDEGPLAPGGQLTLLYGTGTYTAGAVQTLPDDLAPAWRPVSGGALITLGAAVPIGVTEVVIPFTRRNQAIPDFTMTTSFGSATAVGPTSITTNVEFGPG